MQVQTDMKTGYQVWKALLDHRLNSRRRNGARHPYAKSLRLKCSSRTIGVFQKCDGHILKSNRKQH